MSKIETAVILAAGLGSRIRSFTKDMPKGFIPIGEVPIIKQSIQKLLDSGIKRIIIGTGYKSEEYESLIHEFPEIVCWRNEHYATTGSMFTLNNLKHLVTEDFLLLESDLLYDRSGLDALMEDPTENLILASGRTGSKDEVFIEADTEGKLLAMSKNEEELNFVFGELTGITKISLSAFEKMNRYTKAAFEQNRMLDYEYTLVAISSEIPVRVLKLEDFAWCEIDDEAHLQRAIDIVFPKIVQLESRKSES